MKNEPLRGDALLVATVNLQTLSNLPRGLELSVMNAFPIDLNTDELIDLAQELIERRKADEKEREFICRKCAQCRAPIEGVAREEDPFECKADEEPFPPIFYAEPDDVPFKTISLSEGGIVGIRFDGNYFALCQRDREFLNVIASSVDAFSEMEGK